jgi:hypothetical protein
LVVNDATTRRLMRGVRIELRHKGLRPDCNTKHLERSLMCAQENAAIYIAEERLPRVSAEILRGSAEVRRAIRRPSAVSQVVAAPLKAAA